jgi:hypothetical protein
VVSEGGGQGVVVLAALQDLSQARSRWGAAAEGFLSLFPTTVVLPGIADRPTLEALQLLAGRRETPTVSTQHDRRGRIVGYATSIEERDSVTIAQLANGRDGLALAIDSRKRMGWVELTPAYRDPRFRRYLDRSNEVTGRERER